MDEILMGILASLAQDDKYKTNKELILQAFARGQEVGYKQAELAAFMEQTDAAEYERERKKL